MKTKLYSAFFAFAALSCCKTNAQTDKSLSNLTSPTAINQSLLPNANSAKDLGSNTLGWRDIYFSNRLLLKGERIIHSPGTNNFFTGGNSGNTSLTGTNNAGTGKYALSALTNGSNNAAHGNYALNANTTGTNNTANGFSALRSNSTGSDNTASGYYSLYSNINGRDNTAKGYLSLYKNTTGSFNTGNGSWALYSNTAGNNNTASGYAALWLNTTGNDNTALGKYALYNNTAGYSNVAIGAGALFRNTLGHNSVAIGDSALYNQNADFDGFYNTAIGSKSMYSNTRGQSNTSIGNQALYSNTEGALNVATGIIALRDNTTGRENTANGAYSLIHNTIGFENTAIGYTSGYNNINGTYNSATGSSALYHNISGVGNTAMGSVALYHATGSYNTAIGAYADVDHKNTGISNAVAIGFSAKVLASNQVRIGNTYVTSIGGQVGWTTFSDGRYKRNMKENVSGLAFINKLRPVTYTVDTKSLNEYFNKGRTPHEEKASEKATAEMSRAIAEAGTMVQDGFVAQEVEDAAKKLGFEFSGVDKPQSKEGLYGLRYDKFVVPLVKAVQELSKMNDSLNLRMREFETLKMENKELKSRMELIEQKLGISSRNGNTAAVILTGAALQQNIPNPFNNTTTIPYTLPQKFTTAQIIIADNTGKTLKQVNVSGPGNGMLKVDATTISSGAYNYSLVIDGKLMATKQMMLTK